MSTPTSIVEAAKLLVVLAPADSTPGAFYAIRTHIAERLEQSALAKQEEIAEVKDKLVGAVLSLEHSQAAHDRVAADLKATKEERDNYAKWLNESGQANYQHIQQVLELEWELNYAAHCVTKNEELRKKLAHIENELRAVKEERDRARAEALGNAARFRDADARRAENYRMITTIQGERDTLRRELEHVAQCSQNRDSENAELVALLQDVIEGSVDSTTYPDGPNLARDLRAQLRDAISRHAKGEANG